MFVTSPMHLKREWIDEDRPNESMQLFLAKSLEENFDANKERLDDLYVWFQVAAFSVGVEVILGCVQFAAGN